VGLAAWIKCASQERQPSSSQGTTSAPELCDELANIVAHICCLSCTHTSGSSLRTRLGGG